MPHPTLPYTTNRLLRGNFPGEGICQTHRQALHARRTTRSADMESVARAGCETQAWLIRSGVKHEKPERHGGRPGLCYAALDENCGGSLMEQKPRRASMVTALMQSASTASPIVNAAVVLPCMRSLSDTSRQSWVSQWSLIADTSTRLQRRNQDDGDPAGHESPRSVPHGGRAPAIPGVARERGRHPAAIASPSHAVRRVCSVMRP